MRRNREPPNGLLKLYQDEVKAYLACMMCREHYMCSVLQVDKDGYICSTAVLLHQLPCFFRVLWSTNHTAAARMHRRQKYCCTSFVQVCCCGMEENEKSKNPKMAHTCGTHTYLHDQRLPIPHVPPKALPPRSSAVVPTERW